VEVILVVAISDLGNQTCNVLHASMRSGRLYYQQNASQGEEES
jgi:hypothetical protein